MFNMSGREHVDNLIVVTRELQFQLPLRLRSPFYSPGPASRTILTLSLVPCVEVDGRSDGLTMRLILMHLGGWSPNTFHSVWNANNCDM